MLIGVWGLCNNNGLYLAVMYRRLYRIMFGSVAHYITKGKPRGVSLMKINAHPEQGYFY